MILKPLIFFQKKPMMKNNKVMKNGKEHCWEGDKNNYPVEAFLTDSIFEGKFFRN